MKLDPETMAAVVDGLRPFLSDMAAEILGEVRSSSATPTLLPASVTSYESATGNCVVSPDDPGVDTIPAQSLVGRLTVNDRVLILYQPPSGVFVAHRLSRDPNPAAVRVGGRWTSSAVQAVASATVVTLNLATVEDDTDGFLNPTANAGRVPSGLDGVYLLTGTANMAASVGANRAFIEVAASSRTQTARTPYGSGENLATTADLFPLAAGDTFGVNVFQSSGAPINVNFVRLTAYRLFRTA